MENSLHPPQTPLGQTPGLDQCTAAAQDHDLQQPDSQDNASMTMHEVSAPAVFPKSSGAGLFDAMANFNFDTSDIGNDYQYQAATKVDPNRFRRSNPGQINYDEMQESENLAFSPQDRRPELPENDNCETSVTLATPQTGTKVQHRAEPTPISSGRPLPPQAPFGGSQLRERRQNPAPSRTVPQYRNLEHSDAVDPRQTTTTTGPPARHLGQAAHLDASTSWTFPAKATHGIRPTIEHQDSEHNNVPDPRQATAATSPVASPLSQVAHRDGSDHPRSKTSTKAGRAMLAGFNPAARGRADHHVTTSTRDMQHAPEKLTSPHQDYVEPLAEAVDPATAEPHQSSPASGKTTSSRRRRPDRPWGNSRHRIYKSSSNDFVRASPSEPSPSRRSVTSNVGKKRSHAHQSGYHSSGRQRVGTKGRPSPFDLINAPVERLKHQRSRRKEYFDDLATLLNADYQAKEEDDQVIQSCLAQFEKSQQAMLEHCQELEDKVEEMEAANANDLEEKEQLKAQLSESGVRVKECQEKARVYKDYLNRAAEENQTLYKKTKEHHQQVLADMKAETAVRQNAIDEAVRKNDADRARFKGTLDSIREESQRQAHEFQLKLQSLNEKVRDAEAKADAEKKHALALQAELHDKSELLKKLNTLEDNIDEKIRTMKDSHAKLVEQVEIRSEENQETLQQLLERLSSLDSTASAQAENLSAFREIHKGTLESLLDRTDRIAESQATLEQDTNTLSQDLLGHMSRVQDGLQQRNDALDDDLTRCIEANTILNTELAEKSDYCEQLEYEMDQMEGNAEDQTDRIEQLTRQVEELQAEGEGEGDNHLAAQLEEAQQKYNELKEEVESKAAAIVNLEDQLKTQIRTSAKELQQQKETLQKSDMLHREKLKGDMEKECREAKSQLEKTRRDRDAAQQELVVCQEELHRLKPVEKSAHDLEAALSKVNEENSKNAIELQALERIDKTLKKIHWRHKHRPEFKAAIVEASGHQVTSESGSTTKATFVEALPRFVDKLAQKLQALQQPVAVSDKQPPSRSGGAMDQRLESDDPLVSVSHSGGSKRVSFEKHPLHDDDPLRVPPTIDEERLQRRQGFPTKPIIKPRVGLSSDKEPQHSTQHPLTTTHDKAKAEPRTGLPNDAQAGKGMHGTVSTRGSRAASGSLSRDVVKTTGTASGGAHFLQVGGQQKRSLSTLTARMPSSKRSKTAAPPARDPTSDDISAIDEDSGRYDGTNDEGDVRMTQRLIAPAPEVKTRPASRTKPATKITATGTETAAARQSCSLQAGDQQKRAQSNPTAEIPLSKRSKAATPAFKEPKSHDFLGLDDTDQGSGSNDSSDLDAGDMRMIRQLTAPASEVKTRATPQSKPATVSSKPGKAAMPLRARDANPKVYDLRGGRQQLEPGGKRKAKQEESQESLASSHYASQQDAVFGGTGRRQTMPNF